MPVLEPMRRQVIFPHLYLLDFQRKDGTVGETFRFSRRYRGERVRRHMTPGVELPAHIMNCRLMGDCPFEGVGACCEGARKMKRRLVEDEIMGELRKYIKDNGRVPGSWELFPRRKKSTWYYMVRYYFGKGVYTLSISPEYESFKGAQDGSD